ncbi:MAG: hypothetical protein IT447_04055 [Phycisphaerales bacterium]|nr:hypothetical protein [Phycisphaerales bacterium]
MKRSPNRHWTLAWASAVTLLIGAVMIAGAMRLLTHATMTSAGVMGIVGGIMLAWGLVCVMLGVGVYYGRHGAIVGVRLIAWLMILLLAIVLVFQWGDSAGPNNYTLITIVLIIGAGLWHWLIIRARERVKIPTISE